MNYLYFRITKNQRVPKFLFLKDKKNEVNVGGKKHHYPGQNDQTPSFLWQEIKNEE